MKLALISTLLLLHSSISVHKLENLIFKSSELPVGCKIKAVSKTDHLPCGAKANPFISSDPEYLTCLAGNFTNDTSLIRKVDRGLFSVYTDGAEIGIFAVRTDSQSTAESIKKDVEANNKLLDNSELFISGTHVIWLWKDKGKNENFYKIKTLIEKKIN